MVKKCTRFIERKENGAAQEQDRGAGGDVSTANSAIGVKGTDAEVNPNKKGSE